MLNTLDFTAADPLAPIQAALGDLSAVTNVTLTYTGAETAIFEADGFSIDSLTGGMDYLYGDGVLLSSGDAPGLTNTIGSYSVSNGEPGDPDLTAQAQAAYAGAGDSEDAAILELQFDVPADADFTSVTFNVGFGSDEFPEYNDTSFVDIAAAFVNGDNYAVFNNDPSKLLSVNSNSLGDFVDNGSGDWAIEYDGFSPLLTITAPVVEGTNTLRFGVADTGDQIYDSGFFVGGMSFGTSTATGAFVPVGGTSGADTLSGDESPEAFDAGDGDDTIMPGLGFDYISTGGGMDTVIGTPEELNGDIISDFDIGDLLVFEGAVFGEDAVTLTMGSAIFDIDTDGDGTDDTTVTMEGDYEGTEFAISDDGESTSVAIDDGDSEDGDTASDKDKDDDDDDDGLGGIEVLLLLGLLGGLAWALSAGGGF